MGKSGKARKRQRKQQELLQVGEVDGQSSDSDQERNGAFVPRTVDVDTAVAVLQCLARNRDELQTKGLKFLRKALFPLLEEQRTKHFEKDPLLPPQSPEEVFEILSEERVSATIRVALFFGDNMDVFQSTQYKPFRRALHPIVDIYFGKDKKGKGDHVLINLVSQAFRVHDWESALTYLYALQNCDSEIPKLGTLQRWVRECDTVNDGDDVQGYSSTYLLILDAVMRVMIMRQTDTELGIKRPIVENKIYSPKRQGKLIFCPIFSPSFETALSPQIDDFNAIEFQTMFWVASTVPGNQRRPPQEHPLNIYALKFGAIQLGPKPHYICRHDVPGVDGSFLLSNVLTKVECEKLMTAAETLGYSKDVVEGIDNITLIADKYLLNEIFDRVKLLLPQCICGCQLAGINARYRFFRYFAGSNNKLTVKNSQLQIVRPHIDGAWPGSGIDASGNLVDDIYGDRTSRLTFLIYLNEDFEGGSTTFFLPAIGQLGEIETRSVEPRQGSVLVFPHGDSEYSLVHEGSAVTSGTKYVIRTDVLYANS